MSRPRWHAAAGSRDRWVLTSGGIRGDEPPGGSSRHCRHVAHRRSPVAGAPEWAARVHCTLGRRLGAGAARLTAHWPSPGHRGGPTATLTQAVRGHPKAPRCTQASAECHADPHGRPRGRHLTVLRAESFRARHSTTPCVCCIAWSHRTARRVVRAHQSRTEASSLGRQPMAGLYRVEWAGKIIPHRRTARVHRGAT